MTNAHDVLQCIVAFVDNERSPTVATSCHRGPLGIVQNYSPRPAVQHLKFENPSTCLQETRSHCHVCMIHCNV
jgi:hypothetical protein